MTLVVTPAAIAASSAVIILTQDAHGPHQAWDGLCDLRAR